jgi:hypothetical protein
MQQRRPKGKKAKKPPAKRRSRNLTIQAMADGIGVCTATIDKYVKRGCPRTSIEAVRKWRAENIKAVAEDTDDSALGIEFKRAELIDKLECARTRQMKNDLMEGRLIRKDEYELNLRTAASRLMNRLQSLGIKCANICPSELKVPIKDAVEDTVRIAMKEFCDDLRTMV